MGKSLQRYPTLQKNDLIRKRLSMTKKPSFTKDRRSFTFDVLEIDPKNLRRNLNRLAVQDPAIKMAHKLNYLTRGTRESQDKAISIIERAKKMSHKSRPKRMLTAFRLYLKANKIEEEREKFTNDKNVSMGADYQETVNRIREISKKEVKPLRLKNIIEEHDKVIIGAVKWKWVYRPKGYSFYSTFDDRGKRVKLRTGFKKRKWWKTYKRLAKKLKKKNKTINAWIALKVKETTATKNDAMHALADMMFARWFSSNFRVMFINLGKKGAIKFAKMTLKKHKMPKKHAIRLIKSNLKVVIKQKKARANVLKNIVSVLEAVGDVALDVLEVIPIVGTSIEKARKVVKKVVNKVVPLVVKVTKTVDKVKGVVKKVEKIAEIIPGAKEKIKDLGLNPKVRAALKVDKMVDKVIIKTVKKVKKVEALKKGVNIVKAAEALAPPEVSAAMNLIKAAKEMDPTAIAKMRNIKMLADAGLYEAQKALGTMRVALNVQNMAKHEAMMKHRQWQYW